MAPTRLPQEGGEHQKMFPLSGDGIKTHTIPASQVCDRATSISAHGHIDIV